MKGGNPGKIWLGDRNGVCLYWSVVLKVVASIG